MNVKEAVDAAKQHILSLFASEDISNVGLEEVEWSDEAGGQWVVTIGFSRPWDEPKNALAALAGASTPRRSYKVVRISSERGEVLSVKSHETVA